MNLYEATNGYVGASHVRCYVIAKDKERALQIAKAQFKNDEQGENQTSNWYTGVKVDLLHEDCTLEFVSEISD